MRADDVYNIELPSEDLFFTSNSNISIVSAIFQQAISKFMQEYHSTKIPFSFLEFYLKEIMNYDFMFRRQTKDFFEYYNQIKPDFNLIVQCYIKSYFSQAEKVVKEKGIDYIVLNSTDITDYFDNLVKNSPRETANAITNIKQITDHINNSDEIISFQDIYENYMIAQTIKQTEFVNEFKGRSKVILNIKQDDEKPQIIAATKHAERLMSERISVSGKKGKVTKLIIPKLKLPTEYPKTTTFNRFNSKYHANNFISASRQILILNDLQINGVAYSTSFVEKRNQSFEEDGL